MTNKHFPPLNGVRIVKNEVCIKKSEAEGWEIFFDKEPAAILKDDINSQEVYEIEDLIDMDYPPQIVISVESSTQTVNPGPLRLHVEGLSKEFQFVLQPGEFLNSETTPTQDQVVGNQEVKHLDTSEIKCALGELRDEIQKQLMLRMSSDNASLIDTSRHMLQTMESIENIIHDRKCIESMVSKLDEMEMRSQELRQICDKLKVKYDMEVPMEEADTLTLQLKNNYMTNKIHCTTSEWEAAMSEFVTNAANLMRSIREVLVAAKCAHIADQKRLREANRAQKSQSLCLIHSTLVPVLPISPDPRTRRSTLVANMMPSASCHRTSGQVSSSSIQHGYVDVTSNPKPNTSCESIAMQAQQFPPTLPATAQPEYCASSVSSFTPQTSSNTSKDNSTPLTTSKQALPPTQPQPPKPLCKEDMAAVCQCLYPLRARWKTIGTFLCVEHSSLEAVRVDNETADDRLLAMVAVWLQQTTPPPTWQALADAVEYFDHPKAQEIRQKIEFTP